MDHGTVMARVHVEFGQVRKSHQPNKAQTKTVESPDKTCWKEDMAFLHSFYVADDIWRFA